jgi:phospholipid transport system substrate-binding protein
MRTIAWLTLVPLPLISAISRAEVPDGPLATLRTTNEALCQLLDQRRPDPDSEIGERVGGFFEVLFDYEELASRVLGDQWKQMSKSERTAFVRLFRELIERSYVEQIRSRAACTIDYVDERQAGTEATVRGVLHGQHRGRRTDTNIVYQLRRKQARWLVYDVATDDVSLLRNYRSTFARVIAGPEGYRGLLGRMQRRLAQGEEDAGMVRTRALIGR